MADSCATCFFFASQSYTDPAGNAIVQGGCHRFAPDLSQGPGQAQWPFVQGTDWCGDWLTHYPTGLTWSTWGSVVAPASGAFTSISFPTARFALFGKAMFIRWQMNITVNGTAAGAVTFTLPQVPFVPSAFNGIAQAAGSRQTLVGIAPQASNLVSVYNYNGTYPGADATEIIVNGVAELQ